MRRHHWLTLLGILLFPLALYWRVRFKAECEAWRRTRNRPRRWSEKLVRETELVGWERAA